MRQELIEVRCSDDRVVAFDGRVIEDFWAKSDAPSKRVHVVLVKEIELGETRRGAPQLMLRYKGGPFGGLRIDFDPSQRSEVAALVAAIEEARASSGALS